MQDERQEEFCITYFRLELNLTLVLYGHCKTWLLFQI